jgi:hypothetical protein
VSNFVSFNYIIFHFGRLLFSEARSLSFPYKAILKDNACFLSNFLFFSSDFLKLPNGKRDHKFGNKRISYFFSLIFLSFSIQGFNFFFDFFSFLRTCKRKKECEIIFTTVKRDSFLLMRNVKYELKPGNKMLDAFTFL